MKLRFFEGFRKFQRKECYRCDLNNIFLGPTLPDGSVNFECHCVGHLVASPCGHEFREAIKCQKSAGEAALEEGACATEFMNFMQCVIRTGCFKSEFVILVLNLYGFHILMNV